MNCKQGDLAVVVKCDPMPDAVGHIVECIKMEGWYPVNGVFYSDVWRVRWGDKVAHDLTGYEDWGCPDAWMRPIRCEDGEDETFSWAGRPCQQPA